MKKRNIFICSIFAILICLSLGLSAGSKQAFAEEATSEITISFDAGGGTCSTKTIILQSGECISELPTPEYSGYIFLGWIYNYETVSTSTVFSEDATLTASYVKKINKYTISSVDSKFSVSGETADSSYNYSLSSESESLENALELISNDLTQVSAETTINFEDITASQDLNISFQNLILSGTLNLGEYSLCYNAPVSQSTLNFSNLTLNTSSSQDIVKVLGTNSSTIKISNTIFSSTSTQNNYSIKLENPIHTLNFKNELSYSTQYLYNFELSTRIASFDESFALSSPSTIAITIPYNADEQAILSTFAPSSLFEFIPNQTNFTCSVQSYLGDSYKYIYANTNFYISFNENGGEIVESFTETNSKFYRTSQLNFPTEENFKKSHFYLDGFVGKLNIDSKDWYFDTSALSSFISAGSDPATISTYFYETIPTSNSDAVGFTYYKYNKSSDDINFSATNLMLKLNKTPTFVAIWKDITYSIAFEENGGSEAITLSGIYGSNISLPVISKTGYDFVGWFTSQDLAEETDSSNLVQISTMPDTNPTLYAGWQIHQHTLKIYKNNQSQTIEKSVDFGTLISSLSEIDSSVISKTGYSFAGWFTDENLSVALDENQTMPDSDFEIYAGWNLNSYTITLYINHNSVSSDAVYKTLTKEYNSNVTEFFSETPSFEGYTFNHWCTDSFGRYPLTYLPEMMPAEDLTLYASWNQLEYFLTIYYPAVSQSEKKVLHFGDTLPLLIPEYSGLIFGGWFADENFVEEFSLTTMPSEDINVYAKFTDKQAIALDLIAQSYTLSENNGFVLDSSISGFVIEYLVGEEWTTSVPKEKGTYDIRISRNEDGQYKSFVQTFVGGLTITANSVDTSIYSLVLYCIAVLEFICALIVLFIKKQRKTYLAYSVVLPFGVVSTSQFVNLIVSLVLAVFGFVLLITQIVGLKKVNNEVAKVSTENKPYTPPEVSENKSISQKVEILLREEGFVSSTDLDDQPNNFDEELTKSAREKTSSTSDDDDDDSYLSFSSHSNKNKKED